MSCLIGMHAIPLILRIGLFAERSLRWMKVGTMVKVETRHPTQPAYFDYRRHVFLHFITRIGRFGAHPRRGSDDAQRDEGELLLDERNGVVDAATNGCSVFIGYLPQSLLKRSEVAKLGCVQIIATTKDGNHIGERVDR